MKPYFYPTNLCSHKTKFTLFLVCARIRKEFGIDIQPIYEPTFISTNEYSDVFKGKIKPSINHYFVYPYGIEKKKMLGTVVDIEKDSDNGIAEMIYALTENFGEYMLTDWFEEDVNTVMHGRDKRRRYEMRKEMRKRLDLIEAKDWRTKLVVNQQRLLVETI